MDEFRDCARQFQVGISSDAITEYYQTADQRC